MKQGLKAFNPFQVGALREMFAALTLLPFIGQFKLRLGNIERKQWIAIILIAFFGNAIPAFLFPLAETQLNSASVGVLNSMTPISTLIIGASFFGMPFRSRQLLGILLGFAGSVFLILLGKEAIAIGEKIAYGSLVMLATIGYGLSGNLMKKYLQDIHAIRLTIITFIIASTPYWFYFFFSIDPQVLQTPHGLRALGFIAILGALGTAIANIFFHKLISLTNPIFTSSVTYLIPIVAIMWGFLDGEIITLWQFMCMVIIVFGVYKINR